MAFRSWQGLRTHRVPCWRLSQFGFKDFTSEVQSSPSVKRISISNLKPSEVVKKLDTYIVGQDDAKRAVAIALRNRWRRHLLPENFKDEVTPKNILMIGPTGCGKTEIARRLSFLSEAPFIKVEATKFTEVGFHGKDVDTIIKDLVEVAIKLVKKRKAETHKEAASLAAEIVLLQLFGADQKSDQQTWLDALRRGDLDDKVVEVEIPEVKNEKAGENLLSQLTQMRQGPPEKRRMQIKDARPIVEEQELAKLIDSQGVKREAIAAVESNGIVFIDEIDKIASSKDLGRSYSPDASAEGVQRDLLPIIEGCTVNTKFGDVNTDHILFICSGAFHSVKPSDLLAELQGRLPIRVTLKGLTEEDMYRILTEPATNLIRQQVALMDTEGLEVNFEEDALREIARTAVEANILLENIGARRLHSVIEMIMEELSFSATTHPRGTKVAITKELVKQKLEGLIVKKDLLKSIL